MEEDGDGGSQHGGSHGQRSPSPPGSDTEDFRRRELGRRDHPGRQSLPQRADLTQLPPHLIVQDTKAVKGRGRPNSNHRSKSNPFRGKPTTASHPEILTQTISTKTQADHYSWILKTQTCGFVPQNS